AICADESVHARTSLPSLVGKYDAVNIKLDKTGGFNAALAMARAAEGLGFKLMVGRLVASSLAVVPATPSRPRAPGVDSRRGPLPRPTPVGRTSPRRRQSHPADASVVGMTRQQPSAHAGAELDFTQAAEEAVRQQGEETEVGA